MKRESAGITAMETIKGVNHYIDSHVHLDHILSDNRERISWLKETRCVPVSWSFARHIESKTDILTYLSKHAGTIRELSRTRLACYYLAGIHPRNISSDLKPEGISEMLLPYLDDPLCLGIGEIGLETGSRHEEEVLLAQMELAQEVADRGKVYGIHTPKKNKDRITLQTLSLLKSFVGVKAQIVVDHCNPKIIGDVLAKGFKAGVTISTEKATAAEVLEIILDNEESIPRIMLNTDSGTNVFDDLYFFIQSAELSDEIIKMITRTSAERFFGIEGGK
jgi:predicted metal-dependent TIM-barrel fold hydrolase